MLNFLLSTEKVVLRLVKFIAALFFSVSFFLYALQTFLRIFLKDAFLWIDPVSSYLFALSALYGAALAIRNNENIKIEIFKKVEEVRFLVLLKEGLAWLATLILGGIFILHLRQEFLGGDVAFLSLKKWMLDLPYIFFVVASLVFYTVRLCNGFLLKVNKEANEGQKLEAEN